MIFSAAYFGTQKMARQGLSIVAGFELFAAVPSLKPTTDFLHRQGTLKHTARPYARGI
jgi:hypothetical protein